MNLRASGASGAEYRLRNGEFDISGEVELSVSTESDVDADSIEVELQAGEYAVTLHDGWYLERQQDDGGYETVEASLLSEATQPFSITPRATTNVRYRFRVRGELVELGGALSIDIEVEEESCRAEGDSACPGACDYTAQASLMGDSPMFGTLLALNNDTAVIGAPDEMVGVDDDSPGTAHVFARQGMSWVRQARLLPPEGQPEWYFGMGLAVDGDTALIGSRLEPYGERRGTHVFTRNGQDWAWQTTLLDDSYNSQNLIDPIALDGNTAVVGLFAGDSEPGAAYVFVRSGTEWTQQAKLTAPNSHPGDWFGYTVGVSGHTALIGAAEVGAYVFERSGDTWTHQTTLEVPQPRVSDFQLAFAGNTAIIGAPVEDVGGNQFQGAIYVFQRSGSTWARSRLTACDGAAEDFFGAWVAVSGNRLAAISWRPNQFDGAGIVHVFERSAGSWTQIARLDPLSNVQPTYGFPVALSPNSLLRADEGLVRVFSRF